MGFERLDKPERHYTRVTAVRVLLIAILCFFAVRCPVAAAETPNVG